MSRRICLLMCLAALLAPPSSVAADTSLDEARGLYESAQYEKALETLASIESTPIDAPERQVLRRYKALCLIALDRTRDAEQTLEEFLRADPRAAVGNDMPPRMQELLLALRRKLGPTFARERYEHGRDLYERGLFADAYRELNVAIGIIDDPSLGLSHSEEVADLRLLADGFLKLAATSSSPGQESGTRSGVASAATVPGAAVSPGSREPRPYWQAAPRAGGDHPNSAIVSPPPASKPVDSLVPPKAIAQPVPLFDTLAIRPMRAPGDGEIEVLVSADGRVTSARILVSIAPAYDTLLIAAAKRDWRYEPALRDGVPVPWTVRVRVAMKR